MFSTATGITKQRDGELTTPWQAGNNKVNYQQYWEKPVKSHIFILACNVCGCYLEKNPQKPPFLPSAFSLYVWAYTCVYTCIKARRLVLTHILVSEVPRCVSHRVEKERNRRGSSRRSRRGGSPGCAGQGCCLGPGAAGPRPLPPARRSRLPRGSTTATVMTLLVPVLPLKTVTSFPVCPQTAICLMLLPFKTFRVEAVLPLTYLPAGKSGPLVYLVRSGRQ